MIDIRSLRILQQLKNLYDSHPGNHGTYEAIYDFLVTDEKLELNYTTQEKLEMWSAAKKRFYSEHKTWIKADKEFIKKHLDKYYKSELIKRYIASKLPEKMRLINIETGNEVKLLEIK